MYTFTLILNLVPETDFKKVGMEHEKDGSCTVLLITETMQHAPKCVCGWWAHKKCWWDQVPWVTLDSILSFKKHVKMCHVLKHNISNFHQIRNELSTEAAQAYFNGMILSNIQYCITSWSQASKASKITLWTNFENSG